MTVGNSSAVQASQDVRVAFGRLRRRLREVGSRSALSPSLVSVLARLRQDEATTASALAQLEGVRPQSMAATIASLEQLGLLRRSPDPSDGRRQIVALTEAGRNVEQGNHEARVEWFVEVLQAHCTEPERQTLLAAAAILDRLARL